LDFRFLVIEVDQGTELKAIVFRFGGFRFAIQDIEPLIYFIISRAFKLLILFISLPGLRTDVPVLN